jgi:four helix bundle protein
MPTDAKDIALLAWEREQPEAITKDPLWTLDCYREALFLVDKARDDVEWCAHAASLSAARGQLLTSVGSVAANIGEGYGRMTATDRAKYLSYALGSAREAIAWYRVLKRPNHDEETSDRIERLSRVRRMLIGLLKRPRDGGGRNFDRW